MKGILYSFVFMVLGIGYASPPLSAEDFQATPYELYVGIDPKIVLDFYDFEQEIRTKISDFNALMQQYHFSLQRGIAWSEETFDALRDQTLRLGKSTTALSQLKQTYVVQLDTYDASVLRFLATALLEIEGVISTELMALTPVKPPFDIEPETPDFEHLQTYLGPDPGMNIHYAWDLDITGTDIRVRDVEYGFNKNHEELHMVNCFVASHMTISSVANEDYTEHGTPVFGIMMADKGDYGVSGIAHDVSEMVLFPEWQETGYNRTYAVSQAIQASAMGDVILYEMQTGGENDEFVPAEFSLTIWNLTQTASNAGITIVAAAGNGNQNLDAPFYTSYMNRGDSGAIIVGAGSPNIAHNKMSFSTYGSRVDVQGWGSGVYTCGYGNVIRIGNDFNQGYTNFSGTSSATPLVAGCVALLQSYYFEQTGTYLTPYELRDILKETGIPQGSGGHIGPMPNMEAAIAYVNQNFLFVNDFDVFTFTVYPNPVMQSLRIKADVQMFSDAAQVEIYNVHGQLLQRLPFVNDGLIDFSAQSQGVYFISISDASQKVTKKIVKQ